MKSFSISKSSILHEIIKSSITLSKFMHLLKYSKKCTVVISKNGKEGETT